jgi:Fe-S cluster assembly protein SufD
MTKNQILKSETMVWTGKEKEINYEKVLAKKGEELTLLVLLLGKEDNSVSVRVNVQHKASDTTSKVIVKGVLDDSSKVDFEGLTKIDRGAKNSNAWLESRLLLISDKATGRAVPNLEISENEVKAGHAATVGKIDETEIFYLMSRGLPRNQAVKLIVDGFIGDLSKWKK